MSSRLRESVASLGLRTLAFALVLAPISGCDSEPDDRDEIDDVLLGLEYRYHPAASLRLNIGYNGIYVATNGVEDPAVGTSTQTRGMVSNETISSIEALMTSELIETYVGDASTTTSCFATAGSYLVRWTPRDSSTEVRMVGCWLEEDDWTHATSEMLSGIRTTAERLLDGES